MTHGKPFLSAQDGQCKQTLSTAGRLLVCVLLLAANGSRLCAQALAEGAADKPVEITLAEAQQRAQQNSAELALAKADSRSARLDRTTAWSSLLPSATYHNQAIYTQSLPGASTSPRFIASNGVHEYVSQAVLNQNLSLARVATARKADATVERLAAELEVARRGLSATVTMLYFTLSAAANKLAVAERAQAEAESFLALTSKREAARETAHADVVKAQLVAQQRERDLADSRLAADSARLELAVLLFADPRTAYAIHVEPNAPLPGRADVDLMAAKNNPELRSAMAALAESNADLKSSWAAYLPEVNLNYVYGIDASQFAVNAPDHTSNLAHSASVSVDLPVWDWLATGRKVKQSQIRRQVARITLSATQKRLIAHLDEFYAEAVAASGQVASFNSSVDVAAESLRLTRLRYSAGEATVLEVVDAQSAFVSAENAREDGLTRYQSARANLQMLTGSF